jgi:hypothetical protein
MKRWQYPLCFCSELPLVNLGAGFPTEGYCMLYFSLINLWKRGR